MRALAFICSSADGPLSSAISRRPKALPWDGPTDRPTLLKLGQILKLVADRQNDRWLATTKIRNNINKIRQKKVMFA